MMGSDEIANQVPGLWGSDSLEDRAVQERHDPREFMAEMGPLMPTHPARRFSPERSFSAPPFGGVEISHQGLLKNGMGLPDVV